MNSTMNVDQVTGKILPHETTISEAKEQMRLKMKEGTICPCCHQPVKMYHRAITSSMAYALILIFKDQEHHDQFMHLEEFFKDRHDVPQSIRGDVPKLRHWGLLEQFEGEKKDGNPCSGYYRITDLGRIFVKGRSTVPKHVKLYNNKFYGFVENEPGISILTALKNKFNYKKLMEN